jgi:hypothetical protein
MRVVRHIEEGLNSAVVVAGEMTRSGKTLGMEDDFGWLPGIKPTGERRHSVGDRGIDARSWGDDADSDHTLAHGGPLLSKVLVTSGAGL